MTTRSSDESLGSDSVEAAVRAFTVPLVDGEKAGKGKGRRRAGSRWPPMVLVFDTETSTDPSQRLLVGCYMVATWVPGVDGLPRLRVDEEGLFYGDDVPSRDPRGFARLQRFAQACRAETPPGGDRTFYCYSRREFLDEVFWRVAVEAKGLVVGYNLPFDLARLAFHAGATKPRLYDKKGRRRRPTYVDSWSLALWQRPSGKENVFRPRIQIKHIDRNRSLIRFAAVHQDAKVFPGPGAFLDLKTLVFALTDKGMSLEQAGAIFEAPTRKTHLDEFGKISKKSLRYGRHDVSATASLLEVVRHEFDRHPIDVTPMEVRSPATLAKGYLRAMGITAPLDRAKTISRQRLGQASSTYFGGRAECRIRKVVVPVVATDVTSMYPTVNVLARLQEYLIAKKLVTRSCTREARETLAGVTIDHLLTSDLWPRLRFFAEIIPAGDELPLRTTYDPLNQIPTVGVNPVTSRTPLWYTGFDLAASWLLTGRIAAIRRAFHIVPTGQLESLNSVMFRSEVPIDPKSQDIFQTVVETRHAVRNEAGPDLQREALERGLKVYANSGSYGVMAEFTQYRLPGKSTEVVRVEYGSSPAFDATVRGPELPGEFCFPPVAAFITGAARLMLAIVERLVQDCGGSYLAMDTDSIHIVASETGGMVPCPGGPHQLPDGRSAVRALSWVEVDAIVAQLDALKPYGPKVASSLLKIEKENWSRVGKRRVQLYGLALAAKRYTLFEQHPGGRIDIRKRSDHGLGVYLDPTDPRPRTEKPANPDPNQGWIAETWRVLIHRTLGRRPPRTSQWWRRPTVIQFGASSPVRLKPYRKLERTKPFIEQLKPFNFMLAANIHRDSIAPPLNPDHCRLIAPFERDPRRWLDLEWRDLYSGKACRLAMSGAGAPGVAVGESMADMVDAFWGHPEAKSLDPDGTPCRGDTTGLLGRRPVHVRSVIPIGKEAARLEEAEEGLLDLSDDPVVTYRSETRTRAIDPAIIKYLKGLTTAGVRLLARSLGISESSLWRYRRGAPVAKQQREKLLRWWRTPATVSRVRDAQTTRPVPRSSTDTRRKPHLNRRHR